MRRRNADDAAALDRAHAEIERLRVELQDQALREEALRAQAATAHTFQQLLTALHQLGIELGRAQTFDDLCRRAVELGCERLQIDRIGLWFLEDDLRHTYGSFGVDEQGNIRDERHVRRPTNPYLLNEGILDRRYPVSVYPDAPLRNERSEVVGRGWVIVGGLWDGDRVIGTLSADNYLHRRPLAPYQADLLALYSALLGYLCTRKRIEADNQRFFQEAWQRAEEAETLRRAGAIVTATLNLPETIDRIFEQLARVVPYDSASVQLREGDESVIVGGRGFPDLNEVLGWHFPISDRNPNALVYREERPFVLSDAQAVFPAMRYPPHAHIRSWMGVPLIIHDRMIGMITLDSVELNHFNARHARLVEAFASYVAIALEHARLFERARQLAISDPLTGLVNRGHLFELAAREHAERERTGQPLALIMLDIDHFKAVNDTYGHAAGDEVLREVARRCRDAVRSEDVVGRYGGEEFVILLPNTDGAQARQVAERVRSALTETPITTVCGVIPVSASLGIATLTGPTRVSLDTLFAVADQRLYAAKQAGRNQFVDEELP